MNKDRLYLESIRECLERIEEYAAADEDAFMNSRLIQDGVIRNQEHRRHRPSTVASNRVEAP